MVSIKNLRDEITLLSQLVTKFQNENDNLTRDNATLLRINKEQEAELKRLRSKELQGTRQEKSRPQYQEYEKF